MHRKGGGFLLKAAICDDEFVTANYYYEQIEQLFQKSDTDIELDMFTDSGKLLARLYDQERWDIYFLDIDMPLVNGLDLGKKIRELDADCYLVYISIHEECVYDSMKTKPFRFIPKNEFASRIEGCIQDSLRICTLNQRATLFCWKRVLHCTAIGSQTLSMSIALTNMLRFF